LLIICGIVDIIIIYKDIFFMILNLLLCVCFVYRNEFLGIEGMVKIKNPDDNLRNSTSFISIDTKPSGDETDSKRCCKKLCFFYFLLKFLFIRIN